jgi:hypothetical protein
MKPQFQYSHHVTKLAHWHDYVAGASLLALGVIVSYLAMGS